VVLIMTTDRAAAAPALPAGRRAVLYALRRRGEGTAEQIARQLGNDGERRPPAPRALVGDGLVEATEMPTERPVEDAGPCCTPRLPPPTPCSPRPTPS